MGRDGRPGGERVLRRARRVGRWPTTRQDGSATAEDRRPLRLAGWVGRGRRLDAGRVREAVLAGLRARHSPRQVAHRLRREYPGQPQWWVSHETIYQALYVQSRGSSRSEPADQAGLRSGRTRRRARAVPARPGPPEPALTPGWHISSRPPEAADRAVPADGSGARHCTDQADADGYARPLAWADRNVPGRRVWALEGTGSFGPAWPWSWRKRVRTWSRSAPASTPGERRTTLVTPSVPPELRWPASSRRSLEREDCEKRYGRFW